MGIEPSSGKNVRKLEKLVELVSDQELFLGHRQNPVYSCSTQGSTAVLQYNMEYSEREEFCGSGEGELDPDIVSEEAGKLYSELQVRFNSDNSSRQQFQELPAEITRKSSGRNFLVISAGVTTSVFSSLV